MVILDALVFLHFAADLLDFGLASVCLHSVVAYHILDILLTILALSAFLPLLEVLQLLLDILHLLLDLVFLVDDVEVRCLLQLLVLLI